MCQRSGSEGALQFVQVGMKRGRRRAFTRGCGVVTRVTDRVVIVVERQNSWDPVTRADLQSELRDGVLIKCIDEVPVQSTGFGLRVPGVLSDGGGDCPALHFAETGHDTPSAMLTSKC